MNTVRHFGEHGLALLERPGTTVLAVELEQVEGIKERLVVMGAAMYLAARSRPPRRRSLPMPSVGAAIAPRMSG